MSLRQLALALGIFAFLFVAACGSSSPGMLDTDSAAMPWEAPDEAELVGDDVEPPPDFPVPDLPMDDDDDDGDADADAGDEADTSAAAPAADGTAKKATEPKQKSP